MPLGQDAQAKDPDVGVPDGLDIPLIDPTSLALLVPMLALWWGLATCLLGYLIVRINLVVVGIYLGAWAGTAIALVRARQHGLESPTGADQFVLCGSLSVLGALAAWYFARVVLGVGTGIGVCAAIIHGYLGMPQTVQGWLIVAVPAVVFGVAVLVWTRPLVVILSAFLGAAVAVGSAAIVLTEGPEGLRTWIGGQRLDMVPVAVLAGAVIALAIGGIRLQFRLPTLASKWFKPPEEAAKPAAKAVPAA